MNFLLSHAPDFSNHEVVPPYVRRKRQSEESARALQDYRNAQRAVFERMVVLRRQRRLAQLAKESS